MLNRKQIAERSLRDRIAEELEKKHYQPIEENILIVYHAQLDDPLDRPLYKVINSIAYRLKKKYGK